ncbi:RidA family protein [Acidobacteria bacterium AH-259-G07]|nr:RidA family protein [Acidobacteria bacterium AH-259-G07]
MVTSHKQLYLSGQGPIDHKTGEFVDDKTAYPRFCPIN